jgi:hypothetical protein
MPDVTIDVAVLEQTLRNASNTTLPWVTLVDTDYTLNEPTPPPTSIVPTVMATPIFVPNLTYRWPYKDTRQVVIDYVLQRDDRWQTGRIKLFHDMVIASLTVVDEPIPPPIPSPFIPHQLYFSHTIDLVVGLPCGVSLCVLHDSSREGVDEQFGLGFQITDASPAVFPLIGASFVSVIPVK